jgi:hypothetical protein
MSACVDIPSYDPEPPVILRAEARTSPLIDSIYLVFDREMVARPPAAPAGFVLVGITNTSIQRITRPDNERHTLRLILSTNVYFSIYSWGLVNYTGSNLVYSQAGGALQPFSTNVTNVTN